MEARTCHSAVETAGPPKLGCLSVAHAQQGRWGLPRRARHVSPDHKGSYCPHESTLPCQAQVKTNQQSRVPSGYGKQATAVIPQKWTEPALSVFVAATNVTVLHPSKGTTSVFQDDKEVGGGGGISAERGAVIRFERRRLMVKKEMRESMKVTTAQEQTHNGLRSQSPRTSKTQQKGTQNTTRNSAEGNPERGQEKQGALRMG